jgi:hypothetical protein
VPFRVVSRISFPVLGGGVVGLGRGAAITVAGYEAAVCPAGPKRSACLRALQSGLVHLLVVSVARRRREMGLLKALGFVNRQIVASVAWQATALVAVGIVVGVPLGIVLGREVWGAFADNLGVVPVSVVPSGLLVAIVVGILAAANLLAVAPALAARRPNHNSSCVPSEPRSHTMRPDLTRCGHLQGSDRRSGAFCPLLLLRHR